MIEKKYVPNALRGEFDLGEGNPYKPKGVWISVNNGWEDWCKSESFDLNRDNVVLNVKLKKGIKLYVVSSKEKFLKDFKKLTGVSVSPDTLVGVLDYVKSFYEGLMKKYDGIYLEDNVFYRHRRDMDFFTFYTWDCSSMCVWNTNKIEMVGKL